MLSAVEFLVQHSARFLISPQMENGGSVASQFCLHKTDRRSVLHAFNYGSLKPALLRFRYAYSALLLIFLDEKWGQCGFTVCWRKLVSAKRCRSTCVLLHLLSWAFHHFQSCVALPIVRSGLCAAFPPHLLWLHSLLTRTVTVTHDYVLGI